MLLKEIHDFQLRKCLELVNTVDNDSINIFLRVNYNFDFSLLKHFRLQIHHATSVKWWFVLCLHKKVEFRAMLSFSLIIILSFYVLMKLNEI